MSATSISDASTFEISGESFIFPDSLRQKNELLSTVKISKLEATHPFERKNDGIVQDDNDQSTLNRLKQMRENDGFLEINMKSFVNTATPPIKINLPSVKINIGYTPPVIKFV